MPPFRQSTYYITVIKKGTGQKSIGLFKFPIVNKTLLLVPKRVMQASQYWSLNCSGYILSFNIDFFLNNAFPKHLIANKNVLKASIKPFLHLSAGQVKQMEVIFENVLSERKAHPSEKNEMIAVKILELLILSDRFFTNAQESGKESGYNPGIEKFDTLMDKHIGNQRSVSFYAAQLHMHPNHLNHMVKTHTGLTAKRAIDNRITMEAKYLIASSALSIKEIAHQLGFEDPNYFCTFFRTRAHMSPMQYKKAIL